MAPVATHYEALCSLISVHMLWVAKVLKAWPKVDALWSTYALLHRSYDGALNVDVLLLCGGKWWGNVLVRLPLEWNG